MLYYGSATGPTTGDPDWEVAGSDLYDYFGQAVAGIGDINADSYADIAVFTGGMESVGSLLSLFYGSATGLATTADWTFTMGEEYQERSVNVAGVGDVNGDGFDDMAIGNPGLSGPHGGDGTMMVFYGSSTSFGGFPDLLVGARRAIDFGGTLAAAGDVNSDGYDDVIVTGPAYENVEPAEGIAYVYYGSSSGLSRFSRWPVESNLENAWLGIAAYAANDVDSDGYDDIVVTAPGADRDADGSFKGEANIYGGSASGMVRRPLGIASASVYDDGIVDMDVYGTQVTSGQSLVGSEGVDVVITVQEYAESADVDGPAVLVYPNISL
jgi:hypothetical protein